MKRPFVWLALLVSVAACDSGPRVIVRASDNGRPIQDLPVQLLPFDREVLLDSLRKAYKKPEPTVSQEVLQRQDSLVRDSARVFAAGDTAVTKWRAAVQQVTARIASVQKAHREWEDSVYATFPDAAKEVADARDLSEASDTTSDAGRAELPGDLGQYWIYARYILANSQLEWNVPVTLSGDSAVVELTRRNAKEKPLH